MTPLCTALEDEAELTTVGRVAARQRLRLTLTQRVQWQHWLRVAGSEVQEQVVNAPIFIVGLPRTGTTLLQRLLGEDPRFRSLLNWEAQRPAPGLDRGPKTEGSRDARLRAAIAQHRGFRYLCPRAQSIHYTDPALAEEDILLLDHSLLMQSMTALTHVPSYHAWLETEDFVGAYELERTLLQLLMWSSPSRSGRWLLKSPAHLFHLAELLTVFPDATIVWTHRDPSKVLPSLCSLVAHLRGMMTDSVNPHAIGRFLLADMPRGITRSMRLRDEGGDALTGRFVDVHYEDLIADPVGQALRVYGAAGVTLEDPTVERMRRFLASNRQHKHGKHRYSLAEFGLDRGALNNSFAAYCSAYGVPLGV